MLFILIIAEPCFAQERNFRFNPGKVWLDDEHNVINAHGGGMLYHGSTYYWYGEYKQGKTVLPEWATWECYRTEVTGVSCYSSK
ncbi:MAG: glycosyl hydrolase family 43, partial [Prevotella sp.]|nr:glycosyl hydrolase family 43 [Prevotella sp.]